MKTNLHIEHMLTNKYNAAYRHLDGSMDVCTAKMSHPKLVEDRDESWTRKALVTVSPAQREHAMFAWKAVGKPLTFSRFMANAISNSFDSGCSCSHDCCGHAQSYASVHQTKNREFVAVIHYYVNV